MTHAVEGFIARSNDLERKSSAISGSKIAVLNQGFSILPVTDDFAEAMAVDGRTRLVYVEFRKLDSSLEKLALEWSAEFPLVYFETDYFGGWGSQAAILYSGGSVEIGPTKGDVGIINTALRELGATQESGMDEFDSIGLQRFRTTDDWIKQPAY